FLNLQGLREATGQKVSFVFTSYKSLENLVPDAKPQECLEILDSLFLKPAQQKDMISIFQTLEKRYDLKKTETMIKKVIDLSGGHVQYLQLALVFLHQKK